jgi:hypothetical protein
MAAPSMSVAVALAGLGLLVASPCADAETRQMSDENGEVISNATPERLPLAGTAEANGSVSETGPSAASAKGYDSLAPAPAPVPTWRRLLNTIVQMTGAASR